MSERLTRFRKGSAHPIGANGANGQGVEARPDIDYERDRNNISLFLGMNSPIEPSVDGCALSVSSNSPDSPPVGPCACGCGEFCRAPGECWRCASCEPQALPADAAGWAFCAVPGGTPVVREPLAFPPGRGRPRVVYLDEILPDPETAPIGKCAGCRFTSPLTTEGLCAPCVLHRIQP
jgi:hypothetical protein